MGLAPRNIKKEITTSAWKVSFIKFYKDVLKT